MNRNCLEPVRNTVEIEYLTNLSQSWSLHMPEQKINVVKQNASGKKAILDVANAFLSRLEQTWPISNLKISKMPRKMF